MKISVSTHPEPSGQSAPVPRRFRLLRSLCFVLATDFLALLTPARAQTPGTLDTGFNPNANDNVLSTVMQPGGRVVIGGTFTTVGGVTRNKIARVNADGTLDTSFNPNLNDYIRCLAVQTDGKIVIGGGFTAVGGVTRNRIARLNTDGTLDASFNPNVNNIVYCIAIQADGKILIGGAFGVVSGVTRNRIARLNLDGTLDVGFNPNAGTSTEVDTLALQQDGEIVIGGAMSSMGGVTRIGIARVNADGTLDTSFNPNPNSFVYSAAIQSDGKIVIGGFFGTVAGATRNGIARLNADGTLDSSFPNLLLLDDSVTSTAVQVDGKIILAGAFSSVNGVARNYFARVNADGALDMIFNPNASVVFSTTVQSDGKIVIGGTFNNVGGVARNRVGRLQNDTASQSLSVPSTSRVQWLRSGASPETQQVSFELSNDSGATWSPLGTGARATGGWELTSLSLPTSGQVRARARTTGGFSNGSSGLVESVTSFTIPEIAVEQPAGTNLTDGVSTVAFGTVLTGANTSLTFTIKNTGGSGSNLTGLGITIDGANASDFSVTTGPTAPVVGPSGSTIFTLRFAPTTAGAKISAIHIASNDADENPFDIALTGQALLDTDGDGVTDYDELYVYGTNPYLADTDGDGMPDGWEIAHGLNPRVNDANDDADLDGLTNLEEYLAGTDPQARYTNGATVSDYERIKGERRRFATYDGNDRLIGVQYTNGVAFAFIYDGNSNLVRQTLEDVDADHAGLPDVWEVAYGLSTSSGIGDDGPWGDPDHDGWTNYQEWKAGTNPRDPNSHPDPLTTPATLLRQTPTLARLLPAASTLGALPTLNVKLWDGEGNAAKVFVQYFDNATQQWKSASLTTLDGSGYDASTTVSALPTGTNHTLVWNAYLDLGSTFNGSVLLRTRGDDPFSTGAWSESASVAVNMNFATNSGVPDAWALQHSLNPNGASFATTDTDRDGLSDMLEYALNTNPRQATPNPAISGEDAQRHLTLAFTRRKNAPQLQYIVEVSDDLATWHSGSQYTVEVSAVDQGDGTEVTTARSVETLDSKPRYFIRLRVQAP